MRKLLLAIVFALVASSASAQTCPTRPPGDSTNACASTAFVATAVGPGVGVTTFNGRAGFVVPQADDYKSFMGLTVPYNCTITASVASNNLTVSLRDNAGAVPTSTSPCVIPFRDVTATAGDYTPVVITAATSIVLNSGSTLGASNSVPFRVWITAWNNAGTVSLGLSRQSNSVQIFGLDESQVQSSTACNACASATSGGVFYTTAAQTNKAIRIIGFMEFTLPTAGAYSAVPTLIQLFGPGIKLPGDFIQSIDTAPGLGTQVVANGGVPVTITGLTATLTLKSAANAVNCTWSVVGQTDNAGDAIQVALARGGVQKGMALQGFSSGTTFVPMTGVASDVPGSVGPLSYVITIQNIGVSVRAPSNFSSGAYISCTEVML